MAFNQTNIKSFFFLSVEKGENIPEKKENKTENK